jgi:HD-GYP domain-containing protein (c-di-GMP phosphodiesterase class II)
MTTDRPYRRARPLHEALQEITASSGEQFCPRVVAALLECMDREPGLQTEVFGNHEAVL